MKCVICKHGETHPGRTTVTLQRNGTTMVVKNVPAEVCDSCGEAYVDETTARELLLRAEEAAQTGVTVRVLGEHNWGILPWINLGPTPKPYHEEKGSSQRV